MHFKSFTIVLVLVLSQTLLADAEALVGDRMVALAKNGTDSLSNRSMILNNLKRQYQFQVGELSRQLHELGARLAIDGMGVSGRHSLKDQQLAELARHQMELEMRALSATCARQQIEKMLKDNVEIAAVARTVDNDPRIVRYRNLLDDVDLEIAVLDANGGNEAGKLQKRRAVLEQKLTYQRTILVKSATAERVQALDEEIATTQSMLDAVSKRLEEAQSEIAELTNKLAIYSTLRDEEAATRKVLHTLEEELSIIAQGAMLMAKQNEATTQPANE